jgi:DNA-binding CsgD family transcriptional regulator
MLWLQAETTAPALNETLDRLTVRNLNEVRAAAEALHELALAHGNFRTAPCSNIASKQPMVDANGAILATEVFGWSAACDRWWERPRLALTSPLTLACRYESEPFWCNKSGIHTQQNNPHLASMDLSNFSERAMTEVAIVVPVHLPYGQIGAVSFNPIGAHRTDLAEEFYLYGDLLGLYARKFICSYVRLMQAQRWICSDVRLSKREIECLGWAAVGKTDGEIAMILSRSCATIRFHIHNAAQKLNAVNRSQAVFKAGQLGFLGSVS